MTGNLKDYEELTDEELENDGRTDGYSREDVKEESQKGKWRDNLIFLCIGGTAILFNGIFSLVCYSRLPEKMTTQFSNSGGVAGTMPKLLYLVMSFLFITFFAVKSMIPGQKSGRALQTSLEGLTKGRSQQFISISVVAILTVLNVVMVMSQI